MSRKEEIKEAVRREVRQEAAKMKEMSWGDRIWYIGEYYKYHIAGVLLACGLVAIISAALYNRTLNTRLYLVVINNPASLLEDFSPLTDQFAAEMGFGKKDRLYVDSLKLVTNGIAGQGAMAASSKIAALITARQLDVIISDDAGFQNYAAANMFIDLQTILPEDLWAQLSDRILYVTEESGQTVPMGIDLTGAWILEDMNIVTEQPLLAILSNSSHIDECISLLRYMFPS